MAAEKENITVEPLSIRLIEVNPVAKEASYRVSLEGPNGAFFANTVCARGGGGADTRTLARTHTLTHTHTHARAGGSQARLGACAAVTGRGHGRGGAGGEGV